MWIRRLALTAPTVYLAMHLFRYAAKHPSRVIGPADNPYMLRWHLVRVRKLPRVYVHRFVRSDDDRALHDHPWWFVSILLTGSYIEHTPRGPVRRTAPSVARRDVNHRHRVELIPGITVRTLFITGPVVRKWGFWCPDFLRTLDSSAWSEVKLEREANGRKILVGYHFVPANEFDGCD